MVEKMYSGVGDSEHEALAKMTEEARALGPDPHSDSTPVHREFELRLGTDRVVPFPTKENTATKPDTNDPKPAA